MCGKEASKASVKTQDPKRRRCPASSGCLLRNRAGDSALRAARSPRAQGACVAGPRGRAGRSPGRLPGAPGAQAQDQEQQGRGQGQARGAEQLLQPRLQRGATHARGHVFRGPGLPRSGGGDSAAWRAFSAAHPRSGREAGLPRVLPGMSAGSRRLGIRVPGLPSPRSPHPRTPARSETVARLDRRPPGRSLKTGREEGPKREKGLGFPKSEPPETWRRGISVPSWQRVWLELPDPQPAPLRRDPACPRGGWDCPSGSGTGVSLGTTREPGGRGAELASALSRARLVTLHILFAFGERLLRPGFRRPGIGRELVTQRGTQPRKRRQKRPATAEQR